MDFSQEMQSMVAAASADVNEVIASPEGRAVAVQFLTESPEIVSADLAEKILLGAAGLTAAVALAEMGRTAYWTFDLAPIDCQPRSSSGTEDKILACPEAAARFQEAPPDADWVILEGVGHCPLLDVPEKTVEPIAEFAQS